MTDQIDGTLYRAESFLAVGQTDRAETAVRDALEQHPGDARLFLALAHVREQQERWEGVIAAGAEALHLDPDLHAAHAMVAWSAYRTGDIALMTDHALALVQRVPDSPVAHICLALAAVHRRTPGFADTARHHCRLALEQGGSIPWVLTNAAYLEATLGRTAEARRILDRGLAEHPHDRDLLEGRARVGTTDESLAIVGGLLASTPADPRLHASFHTIESRQRRRFLMSLWLAPALLALGSTLVAGGWRAAWVSAVLVGWVLVGCVRASSLGQLPESVRARLRSRARWRVATRRCGLAAVLSGAVGGVVLAAGSVVGAWLLVVAVVAWIGTRVANLVHEAGHARQLDADAAALGSGRPADDDVPGPSMQALAAERRARALWTPVYLVPFAVLAMMNATTTVDHAGRAVLGVVAALVGLTAIAESVGWRANRSTGTGHRARRAFAVPVAVGLLLLLLGGSLDRLGTATQDWAAGTTQREVPRAPVMISPDRFGPTPTPPRPKLDLPTIPPIDIPHL